LDLSAPVEREPAVGSVPDQAPDAVQAVALVDDQVSVVPFPLVTVLGLAARETAGAGWVTETVADWLAVPPGPVQDRVNVEAAFKAPVLWVPASDSAPDQPPDAVHELAWLVDQVRLALPPLTTVLGLAVSAMVGAGAGEVTDTVAVWAALPPGPVQLSV
jgi:hypothetical protein